MTPMNPYLNLLLLFTFIGLLAGIILTLSHFLGPKKRTAGKDLAYECGLQPVGEARRRFSVKFYMIAILFILFDVEVVFLYPWAVLFRDFVRKGMGLLVSVEMLIFLGVLLVGLIYVYQQKALEWE